GGKAAPLGRAAPLVDGSGHRAPSAFRAENLLREARRQRGLPAGSVPPVCVLDPDGDVVMHIRRTCDATPSPQWACYHSQMWTWRGGELSCGLIGHVVRGALRGAVGQQPVAAGVA